MLDSFEARLADILTDGLTGEEVIVVRPRDGLSDLLEEDTERVVIVVHILSVSSDNRLGDDVRERLGQRGNYQLRTSLYLSGEVAVNFHIALTPKHDDDPWVFHLNLMRVLDRALVVLHAENVRKGRAFQTGDDLGFDLEGFRFVNVGSLPEKPEDFHALRATYHYEGRFWPVETPAEGDIIESLPTRIAVLPIQIPVGVSANAGGEDVSIPLTVDLRAYNGAHVRLVARLKGASPPGELIGDTTDAPAGYVAYSSSASGIFTIVYRPPATLSSDTQVCITLSLAHPQRPTVTLGELMIKVIS